MGHAESVVLEWATAGRLHRLHQGVYAVGHRRLTWHGRCWAAVLGAEANEVDGVVWPAVASHGSAAYLWGLYRFAPEAIDVTAPIRRRAKRGFRVHFSSILAPEDRGDREGIPVTSVPRLLLDLAIRSRPDQLERLLERAEEGELFDLHAVEDVEELKLLGVEMIRIIRPRFQREPEAVIRNLATFLERRRAELHRA